MSKPSILATLCLALSILAACGPGAEDAPPEPATASPEVYVVRGEVAPEQPPAP